jgi:hypothetical protein
MGICAWSQTKRGKCCFGHPAGNLSFLLLLLAAAGLQSRPLARDLQASAAAGNLAFPLLLVGGLFLLSRRSQGGMGGPGGNNPLAFGKSKAKFQMEPNTGITFDDVAGVDEAKQDFMEVRAAAVKITCMLPCAW